MSQPLQIESSPDMTSQVTDPSISPESGECYFFKLPAEIRVVIYNLVLEDFGFDGEAAAPIEDGNEKDDEAADASTNQEQDENKIAGGHGEDQDGSDGAQGDDEGQDEGEEDEHIAGGDDGEEVLDDGVETEETANELSSGGDEIEDTNNDVDNGSDDDEADEDEDVGQGDEADEDSDANSDKDDEDPDGDFIIAEETRAFDNTNNLHLTRPPLLNTSRLIRQEVYPLYHNRLATLCTKTLQTATRIFKKDLKLINTLKEMHILGIIFEQTTRGKARQTLLSYGTRSRALTDEIEKVANGYGKDPPKTESVVAEAKKAMDGFLEVVSELFGFDFQAVRALLSV